MSDEVKLVTEAAAYVGGKISHNDLGDLDKGNLHVIESITGLRQELDDISALKNIESKDRGVAQY